jgi:sulfonate transport system substrate-binding protein
MTVTIHAKQRSRSHVRRLAALLCAAAVSLGSAVATFAADAVVLRVGNQKGGNRSLLEISGLVTRPTRSNGPSFLRQRRSSKR